MTNYVLVSEQPITYSICIPVYNSGPGIGELVNRIKKVMAAFSFEVILVDDGSDAATKAALQMLADPSVHIYVLTRNFGKIPALFCAMEKAKGAYVITMDDDGQHSPEALPGLIQAIQGHDAAIAVWDVYQQALWRRMCSSAYGKLQQMAYKKPKGVKSSPFRIIRREIVHQMFSMKSAFPMPAPLLFYVTRDVVNVEVRHEKRLSGKSGFTVSKMLAMAWGMLINHSSLLLRAMIVTGFLFSFCSLGMGIYFLVKKLCFGIAVTGWTSLFVYLSFLGGLLLMAMGVLGEYMNRLIRETEKRPLYFVKEKIGSGENDSKRKIIQEK